MIYERTLTTAKKSYGNNSCEYIIVHHTGSPNYEAMCKLLSGPKSGRFVSVHYVVAQDGSIAKIGTHLDILWHAGKSLWKGLSDFNKRSIGIEICSNGHDYTDNQREAVVKLIAEIKAMHAIPSQNILRHADISGYRGKWDVGPNFYTYKWGTWDAFQASFEGTTPQEKAVMRVVHEWNSKNWKRLYALRPTPALKAAMGFLHEANQQIEKLL